MKTRCLSILLALFLAANSWAQVAVVRGRLTRGAFPAVYVPVTVYSQMMPRSSPAITGQDGMYYLYNIPFGDYYLEVWINPQTPLVYPIRVWYPNTDIPPINLP